MDEKITNLYDINKIMNEIKKVLQFSVKRINLKRGTPTFLHLDIYQIKL